LTYLALLSLRHPPARLFAAIWAIIAVKAGALISPLS